MKLHKSALVVCRASVCLTALAVNQVFAQYQRTWTVGGWLDRRDYAADITLDGGGNLYVGGETEDVYGTPPSGQYSGAIVAKLNPAGSREWLSNAYSAGSLDHVADIAVD